MTDPRGLRIGDAERETAVSALGEHFAQGRLDSEEYDERVGRVWAARTRGDLPPLFDDLPGGPPEPLRLVEAPSWAGAGPHPSYGAPSPGVSDDWRRRGRVAREKASAAPTWLVVVAAVILVPVVISGVVSAAPFIVAGLAVWFFLAGPGRSGCGGRGRRHHRGR